MSDEELNSLWKRAKAIYVATLQSEEEKSHIDRYFSLITRLSQEGDVFSVYTSNQYSAEIMRDKYADKIKQCLMLAGAGESFDLCFKMDEAYAKKIEQQPQPAPRTQVPEKHSSFISTTPLNEGYTFDEFVKGPSNSFALASAMGAVKNPGKSSYNPLFIHGGTGLGKTHLMQAIGNELKRKHPSMAICYLTAEQFLNEYVDNLTNSNLPAFRNKYRSVDVLLLDDVQFFQRGKDIQEEFFNTFNALQQANKQVVMTSDVAPKNLPSIEARLISRFEGGIVQEIETPSYETRLAILKKKAEGMELNVPTKALEFIAENINSHVRAMEGALSKVAVFMQAEPTMLLTNEVLSRLLRDSIEKENNLKKITIEEIQSAVAKKYGVTVKQILSSDRTQFLVTARHMAMYIARKYSAHGLQAIGTAFDRSHATILHGVKNIESHIEEEADLKASLADILASMGCSIDDKLD